MLGHAPTAERRFTCPPPHTHGILHLEGANSCEKGWTGILLGPTGAELVCDLARVYVCVCVCSVTVEMLPCVSACDHLLPLDGLPEELHHVLPLAVGGLEALGPGDQDPLQEPDRQRAPSQPSSPFTRFHSKPTYGVQAGLVAGEGEGEAQRQTSTFHPHVVQEVGDAVDDVVEELGGGGRRVSSDSKPRLSGFNGLITHLLSRSLHDLDGNGVNLVVHLHGSSLPAADLHQQHPEVCPSQIQSEEISVLCAGERPR